MNQSERCKSRNYCRNRRAALVLAIDRLTINLTITLIVGSFSFPTFAQLIPDETLREERSQVVREGGIDTDSIDRISGGARRGSNLFHSFREFNVAEGNQVYFNNPSGIANILTRVTGSNRSEIRGILGVAGSANLFLLNPNGILFGPNAQLDLRGSFVASTANSFVFNNGTSFSTNNPQPPSLLTISTPVGLQYGQGGIDSITTNGTGGVSSIGAIELNQSRLAVDAGRSLLLVGGDITIARSTLKVGEAIGGRVELASVNGAGTVGLNTNGSSVSLDFPQTLTRGDIQIRDRSEVNVTAAQGGTLVIHARNLAVQGQTTLQAGIAPGRVNPSYQAGDIIVDTTGQISLTQTGRILNQVGNSELEFPVQTAGNAGAVRVRTNSLLVTDGSAIDGSTFGLGNGGSVFVDVRDQAVFRGFRRARNGEPRPSTASSSVVTLSPDVPARGNGGLVRISARSLSLTEGAQLISVTTGEGNSGDVEVNVRDRVTMDGVIAGSSFSSGIVTLVTNTALGNSGDIRIRAGSLSLTGGARLFSSTFGQGNAGNIDINTREGIVFAGFGRITTARGNPLLATSGAFAQVEGLATGRGGNITVRANRFSMTDGTQLGTSTRARAGQSNAGNIRVVVRDRLQIAGGTRLDSEDETSFAPSGINASVELDASGRGGTIVVDAGTLALTNRAQITTSTQGQRNAGNIRITADVLQLANNATINAQTSSPARGGTITIDVGTIALANQGRISSSTEGPGNAGNIRISTDLLRLVNNSTINAQTISQGRGGAIRINATAITAANRGEISVNSQGTNRAGNIDITARTLQLRDRSQLSAETASAQGGNITLQNTNLTIAEDSAITVSSDAGRAGNLIVAADQIVLNNGRLTAETADSGGDRSATITLQNPDLLLMQNQSQISARASNVAQGGNVQIQAPSGILLAIPGQNNDIIASASRGNGGNIDITAQSVLGIEARAQTPTNNDINASSNFSQDGTVTINRGVDPNRSLVRFSEKLPNASDAVNQVCRVSPSQAGQRDSASGELVVIGRGGRPSMPSDLLNGEGILADWIELDQPLSHTETPAEVSAEVSAEAIARPLSRPLSRPQLTEAQGWLVDTQGQVQLVAIAPSNHALMPGDANPCG